MPSRKSKKRTGIVRLFAEKLREVRQSRGMTQAELSHQADVSVPHLSEIENAEISPGIELVDRLAKALGTTASDLLSSDDVTDPLPVLHEQSRRMLEALIENGDRSTFLQLNPFLSLLVEAAGKRVSHRK